MTDTLDRLKTALADRQAIEREIGAGGMATVSRPSVAYTHAPLAGTPSWIHLWDQHSPGLRARESLDTIVRVHPTIGDGFLFPAPKKAEKPWSRWHARDLLERAEEAAGIDHLEGGAFHPFRRMWATERKHLPDKDVAAAGGWRDVESLRKSYQQVDEKTLLQVMTNPNRLLDIDVKPQHKP